MRIWENGSRNESTNFQDAILHAMKGEKRILNKVELAAELGMTKRGVEELMRTRKIPFFALGHRTVRFDWEKVQQALLRFEVKAVGGSI